MSGWMKYPYNECSYCERYDKEEGEWAIVNNPYHTCDFIHDDCPEKEKYKEGEGEKMQITIFNQLNDNFAIEFCCGDKEYVLEPYEKVEIEVEDGDCMYLDVVRKPE